MQTASFSTTFGFKEKHQKQSFYTDDELDLLYKLEQGLVETHSHDQVMENLRKRLHLVATDEV